MSPYQEASRNPLVRLKAPSPDTPSPYLAVHNLPDAERELSEGGHSREPRSSVEELAEKHKVSPDHLRHRAAEGG
jgi:hypothetical protein